jgi:hypothetical protein
MKNWHYYTCVHHKYTHVYLNYYYYFLFSIISNKNKFYKNKYYKAQTTKLKPKIKCTTFLEKKIVHTLILKSKVFLPFEP